MIHEIIIQLKSFNLYKYLLKRLIIHIEVKKNNNLLFKKTKSHTYIILIFIKKIYKKMVE